MASRSATTALLLALLFAACTAVGVTLRWPDMTGSADNLVTQTAIEICQNGKWLAPTLMGEPRLKKSPLAAWIVAASLRDDSIAGLRSPDPLERDRYADDVAWQARRPVLAMLALTLLGTFALGAAVGDARVGVISAAIVASSVIVLQLARTIAPDTVLLACVAMTNAAVAWALLRGIWWRGWLIAGVALGLGLMAKGPVILVQTVLPLAAFLLITRWIPPKPALHRRTIVAPIVASVIAAVIGLSWYVAMLAHGDAALSLWFSEVARDDLADNVKSNPLTYLVFPAVLFPWTVPYLAGAVEGIVRAIRREASRTLLPLMLVGVPIVVMSCFPGQKTRYLLPLLPAAAVLTAFAIQQLYGRRTRVDIALRIGTWLSICAVIILFFVTLAQGRVPAHMTVVLIAAVIASVCSSFAYRATCGKLLVIGTTVMLFASIVAADHASQAREGRAELRPLADVINASGQSTRVVYLSDDGRLAPAELAIYCGRPIKRIDSIAEASPGDWIVIRRDFQNTELLAAGYTPAAAAIRDSTPWQLLAPPHHASD